MKKAVFSSIVVLGLITLSLSAAAQTRESGFYVGASVGQAKAIGGCNGLPSGFSCKDHDVTYKVFGGYQVDKYFGAELGFVDFGKTKANGTLGGLATDISAKAKAVDLVAVLTIPVVSQLSVLGKVGLYQGSTKVHATAGSASTDVNGDNTAPTWGLGAKYNITHNFAARAEYQKYVNVGDQATGENSIYTLTVGGQFQF